MNNTSGSSSSEFIAAQLGPQRSLPLHWMIPLTSMYVVIFFMGAIGNLLVVIVILKFRFMRENMTNLYLCNLAITDLLSLLAGMPLELYQFWHQYPWGLGYSACHLKSLIPETTACASILTLVTLTVERYRAICLESNSLRAQTLAPTETIQMKKSVIRNIIGIWIISILAALPVTIFTQINYLTDLNGQILTQSAWCGLPFNSPNQSWEKFMIMSTVAFFIIPLIVMTLLYSLIGQTLRRANRIPNPDFQLTDQSSSRKIMKSRTIVVRLLVAIVIAFTICWTPFHAQRLLFLYVTLYGKWTDELRNINQVLFVAAGVFYYLNSSVNPILYSVMSTRFRAAFSLYTNDLCFNHSSHSSNSDRQGSRGGSRRVTRKAASSDGHSRSDGHQSVGPTTGPNSGGPVTERIAPATGTATTVGVFVSSAPQVAITSSPVSNSSTNVPNVQWTKSPPVHFRL